MNCEELAGLGKVRKEVEPFEGLKIMMHSLSVSEEVEVNSALSNYPSDLMARSSGIQKETLVRAIESIGTRNYTDQKELRTYIDSLQRHTLGILWAAWTENFDSESMKKIEDLKKNSAPLAAV